MKRVYRNKDITVYWDSDKCVHSTYCILMLPDVFNPRRRPWVNMQAAGTEDIKKTIDTCPSGALTYKLNK
jgi:uncharacterized Fe-S cluster protein YjdI